MPGLSRKIQNSLDRGGGLRYSISVLIHIVQIIRRKEAAIRRKIPAAHVRTLRGAGPRKAGMPARTSRGAAGDFCAVAEDHAVIMVPSITVKSTPSDGGAALFVIHEGYKVNVRDKSMKDWVEISISAEQSGWVPRSSLEII